MFKIKLLTLLFSIIAFIGCSSNFTNTTKNKVALDYISGGEDGLVLKNQMMSYLQSYGLFDPRSNFIINANINHKTKGFITKIDNTSDRINVRSSLKVNIKDNSRDCIVFRYDDFEEQFFVSASSIKHLSNKKAQIKIKNNNTEILTRNFIHELHKTDLICLNEQ
jgi:hypothetical protein